MRLPLASSKFRLDTTGVAGFFGGDEAIYAMATVHVYEGMKWMGWYNSPGSYIVAKRYSQLARSRVQHGSLSGVHIDPAALFELDGSIGPEYMALNSGSLISDTGLTGYLFMEQCASLQPTEVPGRTTTPVVVTIARLETVPECELNPTLPRRRSTLLASIPILSSLCGCAFSGVSGDWYCFSMILLGILTNGIACFVIGSADLTFTHPKQAQGSPREDGILKGEREMVILSGEEGAVNSVTRGSFSLRFQSDKWMHLGLCSWLLTAQFLAQLLVIPQGTLFGQIMFVSTLAVSWIYNSYLWSLNKGVVQRKMLVEVVLGKPSLRKFKLGTRTTMAVFMVLVLQPRDPRKMLDDLLPNNTATWRVWKEVVVAKMEKGKLKFEDDDYERVVGAERHLLMNLYRDAEAAYEGFVKFV